MKVDFCLETNSGLIAIEAKNRNIITKKDYTSLIKLKESAGSAWLSGFVLYRGNEIKELSEGIWAIPSCRLFS